MKINRQMIENILRGYINGEGIEQDDNVECSWGELVDQLVRELNFINEIQDALAVINDQETDIADKYRSDMAQCMDNREEILNACTHYSTTSYSDDSKIICDICGRKL